jgi:DNA-binding SARP family transcriptional activator/tetratricopeptide (TPR) repeat protein
VQAGPDDVRIEMLGQFRIVLDDRQVTARDWPSRRAHELVALLALADGRTLLRDQVVEQLWPHLGAEAGAANLRKAAHHARRTLGHQEAIVLRSGRVELFPARSVSVDVEDFVRDAQLALRDADADTCAKVAARCPGELLPDAPYESWTQEPRRQVHAHRTELLRRGGDWQRLMEVEPTDEAACRELMRTAIDAGRRHVAIRWFERLRIAMLRELGAQPDAATLALYDQCTAGVRLSERAFVGREIELAQAAAQLKAITDGGTAALLVRGPAGIGKSAFCREVVNRARGGGWSVTTVTATASGTPYAPIGSVIEQLLVHGRPAFDALPARTRAVLAELSPLARPAPPLQGALTRHQVVAALRRALALPGPVSPTVLVVEDAHLLDEATADVLHQLVAGGGGDPLLVFLAYRAEWMRTSLPRGIIEAARNDRTLSLQLGPLDDREVAELVAHNAPIRSAPDVVARIVRAAEGSPFFALELARALACSGADTLPQTARQAITRRLVGLDPTTMDALTTLAVADDELDLASVLALTGLRERDAFALLDSALDSGVLVVAGARYRFRHGLVRRALTDELPAHRRLQLHRDAARRMVDAGGTAELIAHHWLKGERPGEAVEWLVAATLRAVGVGAFADALAQVERLLLEEPAHHDGLCLRAEILDALGDGRAPEAYATAAVALGDPEAQELRARQALAQLKASNPDSALRTLEGVTPKTTVGRLAEALTLSAAAAIGRYADADTAATKAEEAHRLAVELGDPGAILDATWAQALAAHAKGELPARLREYLRATQDLPELATRVFDGQLCVTERMLYGGLPNDEIIAFADGLAAEAQRIGAARGHAFALTLRGEAAFLAGRVDEADRDFAEGARLHGRIGAVAGEALSLLGRAQVAIYRGRPEHARPFLTDALLMARESEVGHHTLDRIYGAMIEGAGNAAAGVRLVREAETAIQGPAETCPTCRIAFIVPATIAAARGGDLARAHRYAQDCDKALEIVALPPAWHAAVEEARGWVTHADGRPADARGHFLTAAEGFRTWGQPLDAQRCAALADT